MTRAEAEARIRARCAGVERVVFTTSDEVADVVVRGDSLPDALWSALVALLPEVAFTAWDVAAEDDCGALACALDRGARPGALSAALGAWPTREQGPRVVVDGAAIAVVGGA